MSISKLLFGEIALKKKLVTKEQVEECLEIQKKLKEMGITKTLGAVMHDKKYLSMVEIKEILREMTGTKDWNAIEGYEILGKLGKGGMGSVYKARHQKLDKLVALKVLPPELASDQEYLDRFLREARAAAKLNHPNIVQALDVGESYGYHYFAMEYVEGHTVKDLIEQDGAIAEGRALDIISQVAEALVHAWKNAMIHRDIKPSNIIVNEEGTAKLCDLGLAKSVTDDAQITQTGVIMGTPFYLSPEQARSEDLDCRSDIYSLGVTLFHMLTGQVPFTGNSAATILYKHIFLDPPKPKSLNPKITTGASQLVTRMLSKKREDRPQDPAALLEEVAELRSALDRRDEMSGGGGGGGAAAPSVSRQSTRTKSTDDVRTVDMPRLDNTLVESGRETVGETGAITAAGGISGPNVAVRDEDATVGGEQVTEVIRGGGPDRGKAPVAARPAAARRKAGPPRVLIACALLGLAAIAGVVALDAYTTPAGAVDTSRLLVLEAVAGGAVEPGAAVSEVIARAEKLRREGNFAGAAKELAAEQASGRPRSAVDEAALLRTRETLTADASREFGEADRRYALASNQVGQDVEPVVKKVQALDLPSFVRLVEGEKARLEAEKAALKKPAAQAPQEPEK